MAKVHITLVGGQPAPVFQGIKYSNPDKIIYICSEESKKEIEIILVDDGATDGSGAVCDAYAQKDERIRVIHKSNGGLTSAWKAGAAAAKGRYLGFVDSDDWVEPDFVKTLLQAMQTHDAPIAECAITLVKEDGTALRRRGPAAHRSHPRRGPSPADRRSTPGRPAGPGREHWRAAYRHGRSPHWGR